MGRWLRHHVLEAMPGHLIGWVVGGGIVALSGISPDEWVAHLVRSTSDFLPRDWSAGISALVMRSSFAGLGVLVIGTCFVMARSRQGNLEASGEKNPNAAQRTQPSKPSIAVLPFQNLGGNPDQEYFADGMVEDITTALARFSSLFVIARNSSFAYKNKPIDIKQAGRELGVRYVLEGSVRKSQDRLRISAHLVDTESGSQLWADTYDRVVSDVFTIQDDIVAQCVGAIEPSIKRAEIERAKRSRPHKLDAYDLYLRALPSLYAATIEGNKASVRLLKEALSLDPNYADAAAAIALSLSWQMAYGGDLTALAPDALRYAQMALDLDNENADALAIMARLTCAIKRQYEEGVILSDRAVEANPNSAFAWMIRGWVRLYREEPVLGKQYLENALRLGPRDPFNHDTLVGIAVADVQLEQYEDAVAAARRAVQQNANHAWSHRLLAISLALAGHKEEAREATNRAMKVDPHFSIAGFQTWNPFIHGNQPYVEAMRLAGFPE